MGLKPKLHVEPPRSALHIKIEASAGSFQQHFRGPGIIHCDVIDAAQHVAFS
jgi:hypothetical protein